MKKLINKADKIFIAGHLGMVGSAIKRNLLANGYFNLINASRLELDLLDYKATNIWIKENKPDVVILAAAKVGGIVANNNYPADFILQNLTIQTNVIKSSWEYGVRRLLFLGSSCIYPRNSPQPIREETLLTGSLERTNEMYALAKITGIKLCQALYQQYEFDSICLMPTNLYGPGDNYHPDNSHVIPGLIQKFHKAKLNKAKEISCWGTGSPMREFLHVDDLAECCRFVLEKWNPSEEISPKDEFGNPLLFLNVGCGTDISIRDLASMISKCLDYNGEIKWDESFPDGTPRKRLDVSRIKALGWRHNINLSDGIKETVAQYLTEHAN